MFIALLTVNGTIFAQIAADTKKERKTSHVDSSNLTLALFPRDQDPVPGEATSQAAG